MLEHARVHAPKTRNYCSPFKIMIKIYKQLYLKCFDLARPIRVCPHFTATNGRQISDY